MNFMLIQSYLLRSFCFSLNLFLHGAQVNEFKKLFIFHFKSKAKQEEESFIDNLFQCTLVFFMFVPFDKACAR